MYKHEEIRELILQKEKEGKVVFNTIEGLMEADIDLFIKQPAEGILYDLNRDQVTILSQLDNEKWINDYAVALVIKKLKEYYDSNYENELKSFEMRNP